MIGADEYSRVFGNAEQIGRLYVVPGSHARGPTFHVYVLPEGEKAIGNGMGNAPLNKNAVAVYGIVSGNPGWTEAYGWLRVGKWKDDFLRIYDERNAALRRAEEERRGRENEKRLKDDERVRRLLDTYV